MKNKILYYFAILVLFLLALFPTILRIALPDKKNEENKTESHEQKLLACTSSKYITATNYDGDKVSGIKIKKIKDIEFSSEENSNEESNENVVDTKELDSQFEYLKSTNDISYTEVEDGELISIDFLVSNHPELKLDKLNNPIETQQKIYEEYGLTCEVRK